MLLFSWILTPGEGSIILKLEPPIIILSFRRYGWGNANGIEFNDTGEVIFLGKYENGKRNGEGRVYNSNRQVIFHGEYHENLPYRGEKYTYNSEGRLIKREKIENKEVLQQNNDINNENKINLESQNENKGLGKK